MVTKTYLPSNPWNSSDSSDSCDSSDSSDSNTSILKLWWNTKTQIVMVLKKQKTSNCDKPKKLKWWQNSKTQIVTKVNNSNCDNSNCDNLKTQIVTKRKW